MLEAEVKKREGMHPSHTKRRHKTKERSISINRLYSILIAIFAFVLFAPLAVADPGSTWDKKIAGAGRFKVLSEFGGAAVFDKETGLVWEQSPGDTDEDGDVDNDDRITWINAQLCVDKVVGNRKR